MKKLNLIILSCFVFFFSCHKEKNVIYELEDVIIEQNSSDKDHLKTTTEFISIAYSDIFGTVISTDKLSDLSTMYVAFGDKKLMEEIVIKNFLNEPSNLIPEIDRSSHQTIQEFVNSTYNKLFDRSPDEYELWHVTEFILNDNEINSELIYFSLMTSNEYRYY